MTQEGETEGYTAADHLEALLVHGAPGLLDLCLANTAPVDPGLFFQEVLVRFFGLRSIMQILFDLYLTFWAVPGYTACVRLCKLHLCAISSIPTGWNFDSTSR